MLTVINLFKRDFAIDLRRLHRVLRPRATWALVWRENSRSSELAIDAYFIFMVRTTTRKEGKLRFYCCASFLRRFKIVCQDKVGFNNLLTLSWLFYSLQMNSVFFLVTASLLFCPVWSGKLSSGWWIWIGYLSVKDGAKRNKKQHQCSLN